MMKTLRCETCRFWDYQGEGETDIGQCRRHAPRPEAEDVMGDAPTHWPYVRAADWCGDHAEPALDEEELIRRTADVSCQRFECTCDADLTAACRGRATDIISAQRGTHPRYPTRTYVPPLTDPTEDTQP